MVAGGGDVVGRGAEAADRDGILAVRQQAGDDARGGRGDLLCSFGEDLCPDQALRQQDGGRRAGVVGLRRAGLDDLAHFLADARPAAP